MATGVQHTSPVGLHVGRWSVGAARPSVAAAGVRAKIEDGCRYRTIGSASALAIAIAASLVVVVLVRAIV